MTGADRAADGPTESAGAVCSSAAERVLDGEAVKDLIGDVVDPCSRFYGTNLSLADLGMIRDIAVSESAIDIELFLDDPSCAYLGQIQHELQNALADSRGGREIRMSVVTDAIWTPDRQSDRARRRLELTPKKR